MLSAALLLERRKKDPKVEASGGDVKDADVPGPLSEYVVSGSGPEGAETLGLRNEEKNPILGRLVADESASFGGVAVLSESCAGFEVRSALI